jgi:GR25 family glycosyltransferase involved in LPS biosynthesis
MSLSSITNITDITNVFYINLEHRKDRKEHIENELNQLGFNNVERFNAVKMKNGRVGCTLSHIKCIEMAKERNYSHVIICEDDTKFTNVELFKKQLNKFLTNKHNWDVVIFAGNNVPPYEQIDESCVSVTRCQTTTCYMVNGHYYDALLKNYKEGLEKLMRYPEQHISYAIDKYWFSLQLKDNWFLITPLTVIQREDYSDIEQRVTNYSYLMTDLDKKEFLRRQQEQYNRLRAEQEKRTKLPFMMG